MKAQHALVDFDGRLACPIRPRPRGSSPRPRKASQSKASPSTAEMAPVKINQRMLRFIARHSLRPI